MTSGHHFPAHTSHLPWRWLWRSSVCMVPAQKGACLPSLQSCLGHHLRAHVYALQWLQGSLGCGIETIHGELYESILLFAVSKSFPNVLSQVEWAEHMARSLKCFVKSIVDLSGTISYQGPWWPDKLNLAFRTQRTWCRTLCSHVNTTQWHQSGSGECCLPMSHLQHGTQKM